MRLFLTYLRKNKRSQNVADEINHSSTTHDHASPACLSIPPSRVVSLRISEDIERRLREDLSKGLSIQDPGLSNADEDQPLASPCSISGSSDRRVNTRSNFPVRLLDTSDIVSYLVEQRQQVPVPSQPKSDIKCRLDPEKSTSTKITNNKHALWRRICLLASYSAGLLIFSTVLVAYFALQHIAQAAIADAHIDWQNVHLDQLSADSVRLSMNGTISSVNFDGSLKSASYEMLESGQSGHRLSSITLPDIRLSSTSIEAFEVQQTVRFRSPSAANDFFLALGSSAFTLRGTTLLKWRGLVTSVRIPSMNTYISPIWNEIRVSPFNAFSLTTLNADMILFRANISVQNASPLSFSLGATSLQLSVSEMPLLAVDSLDMPLYKGSNNWLVDGGMPRSSCRNCTTAHSTMMSVLFSAQKLTTNMTVLDSLGSTLPYMAQLTRHLTNEVSFYNPDSTADAYLALTDTVLWHFSDVHTSLALTVLTRVIVPYGIEQNLVGLDIDAINVVSNRGQVLAKRHKSFEMKAVAFSRAADGSDGSRSYETIGPIVFDTVDRPAMANAMILQDNGLQESRMHVSGTYTAHIETIVGLVKVESLPFNSTIYIRDPFDRTTIVDLQ